MESRAMRIVEYRGESCFAAAASKLEGDGFALFPSQFSQPELDSLRREAEAARDDPRLNRDRCGRHVNMVFWPASISLVFEALRTDQRFFEIAHRALGTADIKQHIQHVFFRDAASPDSFPWHRDEIFRGPTLRSPRLEYVQTALFLDDVDEVGQAAVVFIPGSHRMTGEDARLADAPAIQNRRGGTWSMSGFEYGEALLPKAGMIAAWNAGAIHGSQPNETTRQRRYVLQGYASAHAVVGSEYKWAWKGGQAVSLESEGIHERLGRSYER
jgi:hypothetical protein